MIDHLQLLSGRTTFLFRWVHFSFGFVKKTFKHCFSFYTILDSYTFHLYILFICKPLVRLLLIIHLVRLP